MIVLYRVHVKWKPVWGSVVAIPMVARELQHVSITDCDWIVPGTVQE